MPITILRWKGGAGGDMVLRLLLLSNPSLKSQVQYSEIQKYHKTDLDMEYSDRFEYDQIALMADGNFNNVDPTTLESQLQSLADSSPHEWVLKSHYYKLVHPYKVIDILPSGRSLPFITHANIVKNSREKKLLPNYDSITKIIKNPEILAMYDIYNVAKKSMEQENISIHTINLDEILGGWDRFTHSLSNVGLSIDNSLQSEYHRWLEVNTKFIPSALYSSLVDSKNFDHTAIGLSMVERYCLMVLGGLKFKIIN